MGLWDEESFFDVVTLTAKYKNIPEVAVIKDLLICDILKKLETSGYAEKCVFKGGTSLSKCYPGTIERFSEDIDLTYLPAEDEGEKAIGKNLEKVEKILTDGYMVEKIPRERSKRNKSCWVYKESFRKDVRVKLEIGSSVRPEPVIKKSLRTYVQEYLEVIDMEYLKKFCLSWFTVNVLSVERTFLDKMFAVKRHTVEGTISGKTRHIYDIVRLWNLKEIQDFCSCTGQLKQFVRLVKSTDAAYLSGKRECNGYNPMETFNYRGWKCLLDCTELRKNYESLHRELLYTNKQQSYDEALFVFEKIGNLFEKIGE